MKKKLKFIVLFICIFLCLFSFIFRNKIELCFSIGKRYLQMSRNPSTIASLNNLQNGLNNKNPKYLNTMDYKNIVYKSTNNKPLTLDIYSGRKKFSKGSPVILYIHGGSWLYGNKNIPESLSIPLEYLRNEGFTVISTSYELFNNEFNFQKQVCDIKDTIRWIYKNQSKYNLDVNNIGVIGTSSGAHLGLIACYSPDSEFIDDKNLFSYPSKVKYIIDLFGPTDLSTFNINKVNPNFKLAVESIKDKDYIINKFTPINYVKKDMPPTLIIHSKNDKLVSYDNAIKLYNKLKKYNNNVTLVTLENTKHDISNIDKSDSIKLFKEILKFIIIHVTF